MRTKRIRVIAVIGPTASGKTARAIEIARKRDGEVISADSRQVYTGLDIGTGKVTEREMRGVRHHLIDVASPKTVFSAHDFVRLGRVAIADIVDRGKIPVLCGGTGFYIDALLGIKKLSCVGRDEPYRRSLERKSAAELFALLKTAAPARAAAMDTPSERNNAVRLIRALEIAHLQSSTNKQSTISTRPRKIVESNPQRYAVEWVYVDRPDDELKRRIHDRLIARMRCGMVHEVRTLHARSLSWKRMEELGLEYRYLSRYLRGKLSRKDMLAQLEREIWHYAKRQRTWWRAFRRAAT